MQMSLQITDNSAERIILPKLQQFLDQYNKKIFVKLHDFIANCEKLIWYTVDRVRFKAGSNQVETEKTTSN